MEILATVTIGLFFILLYLKREWYHPAVLFLGTWAFVLALYNLQLFQILTPTDEIIGVVAMMLISFVLGSALFDVSLRGRRKGSSRALKAAGMKDTVREGVFFALCAISIAVMLVDEISIINNVMHGASFQDVMRAAEGKGTVEISGTLKVVLYMFVVHPMTACVSPICAIEVLRRNHGRLKYFAVNVAIVLLSVFHHGGRNAIIVMGFCYIIAYAIIKADKVDIPRKAKIAFAVCGAVGIVAVFALSSSRGIQEIWLSFYAYFICGIPLGQQYISAATLIAGSPCGFFSFEGLFYPLVSIISFFGIQPPESYNMAMAVSGYLEDNYLMIGSYSATGMNTFMPAGAYPYIDGGYIFEFVVMLVYGYMSNKFFTLQKYNGPRYKALYVFWAYGLVLSFCRFYFASYSYFIGLVIALMFIYREMPMGKNKEMKQDFDGKEQ